MKKQLIDRWKTKEGLDQLEKIKKALSENVSLATFTWLEKHDGRLDLRGAKLSEVEKQQKIEADNHSFIKKTGSLKLKKALLENIDFSFADISYSLFQESIFINCLFEQTMAKEIKLIACKIQDCNFIKSNLSFSWLNENIGSDSGSFINTKFIEVNFKESNFYFPIIENCIFSDCDLYATDFDGSRLKNCVFTGKVDSPWFRGYSKNANTAVFIIFNRVDPKEYPNRMENVDFTKATLTGVSFVNDIDLSNCFFPSGEEYLFIPSLEDAITKAKKIILNEWTDNDKQIALNMIEMVYYTKDHYQQTASFIDKQMLAEASGENFSTRFFNLMKKVVS